MYHYYNINMGCDDEVIEVESKGDKGDKVVKEKKKKKKKQCEIFCIPKDKDKKK